MICRRAFMIIYGISENKFSGLHKKQAAHHGCQSSMTSSIAAGWIQGYTDEVCSQLCYAYIDFVFRQYGCRSPKTNSIYMPCIVAKNSLYSKYSHFVKRSLPDEQQIVSQHTFYRIFQQQFTHVKFPKYTRLGTCTECIHFNDVIGNSKLNS